MDIDKSHWIMFSFGFLIDKINLFPFILGLLFGMYINKNIFNTLDFTIIRNMFSRVCTYFDSVIEDYKKTEPNIKTELNNSEKED